MSSRRLVAAVLALALATAGCGGEDEGGGGSVDDLAITSDVARVKAPTPRESIAEAAKKFERAVASGDCRALLDVGIHSGKRDPALEPGDPPTDEECARLRRFTRQFKGYRAGASRALATAGMVDARVRGMTASSVFALDVDRRWKHFSTTLPGSDHQVGTRPKTGNRFDATALAFVKAAANEDCKGIWKHLSAASEFVVARRNDRDAFCEDIEQAFTGKPRKNIFSRLADRGPDTLVRLGATLDTAFHGLRVKDGTYFTLVSQTDPAGGAEVPPGHEPDGVANYFLAEE